MRAGDKIVASQLAGDFTLPRDPAKKLVLVAGGIGITPFRSMLKYLIDRNERRDIVVIYSNRLAADIAYQDILDEARQKLGIETVYTLTDRNAAPVDWRGERGYLTEEMLAKRIPDFRERTFYVSGPQTMVAAVQKTLAAARLAPSQIKKDFFPGFA
jgi:ferredoxin-NADP reductase